MEISYLKMRDVILLLEEVTSWSCLCYNNQDIWELTSSWAWWGILIRQCWRESVGKNKRRPLPRWFLGLGSPTHSLPLLLPFRFPSRCWLPFLPTTSNFARFNSLQLDSTWSSVETRCQHNGGARDKSKRNSQNAFHCEAGSFKFQADLEEFMKNQDGADSVLKSMQENYRYIWGDHEWQ